ncbi:MAG: MaoC family dehydratase [Halobacteriaceae archaeon]
MRGRTFEDYDLGETYESEGRTVTEADLRLFVGATGSTHPAHVDHEYCADHPLVDGVVAHGTLSLAVTDGFLADEVAAPAAIAMNYGHESVRYVGPVSPGDTLSASMELVEKTPRGDDWGLLTLDVTLSNQRDDPVLRETQTLVVATAANPAVEP